MCSSVQRGFLEFQDANGPWTKLASVLSNGWNRLFFSYMSVRSGCTLSQGLVYHGHRSQMESFESGQGPTSTGATWVFRLNTQRWQHCDAHRGVRTRANRQVWCETGTGNRWTAELPGLHRRPLLLIGPSSFETSPWALARHPCRIRAEANLFSIIVTVKVLKTNGRGDDDNWMQSIPFEICQKLSRPKWNYNRYEALS